MGFWSRLVGGHTDESESDQRRRVEAEPFVAMMGVKLLEPCDQIPRATGRFGLDATNPIPVNCVGGEIVYLNTLRARSGVGLLFHRVGSQRTSTHPEPVDEYEVVAVDASQWARLFFSFYYPRRSREVPEGFERKSWGSLSSELRAMVHFPATGVTTQVHDFPAGLPEAVRAAPMLRAVSPGLGDAMARSVERILAAPGRVWTRPAMLRGGDGARSDRGEAPQKKARDGAADARDSEQSFASEMGTPGEHTTLWLPIRPDHPVLAAAGVTATTHVPIFLDGAEYVAFKRTRQLDVSPKALLFGAVLRAFEDPPGVSPEPFRKMLPRLLETLARGFGERDLELMLINVAANLREAHGGGLSRHVWENVVRLHPRFDRARSDLIVDLWHIGLDRPTRIGGTRSKRSFTTSGCSTVPAFSTQRGRWCASRPLPRRRPWMGLWPGDVSCRRCSRRSVVRTAATCSGG